MRVLIVKLSSLGDVVHAMPVVHDILAAHPGAQIDWVVEPSFAPLVRRVAGVHTVIECALRRWRKAWWTAGVRAEWRAFRQALQAQPYDAIIDLQGLTKSALVARMARGTRYGLANRTEGSSYEAPARWLVDHAITIAPHTHALDRSRELAARALGYALQGLPQFGLQSHGAKVLPPLLVLVHGTAHDDKLWPEENWIEFGLHCVSAGYQLALPHAGPAELARAERIATAIGRAVTVWPAMGLGDFLDRLGEARGVIGVDSGLSHIAVALGLPHLQLYNSPTSWRTGPQAAHGHLHQASVERSPTPEVDLVWAMWQVVRRASHT